MLHTIYTHGIYQSYIPWVYTVGNIFIPWVYTVDNKGRCYPRYMIYRGEHIYTVDNIKYRGLHTYTVCDIIYRGYHYIFIDIYRG